MRNTLLILLLVVGFTSCKKEKKTAIEQTENQQENVLYNGKHCFFSKIEDNSLILDATIKNDSITGNYDYLPKKGKANKGVFVGTLNGDVANTICEFTQNGKKVKEELVFKISKDKVSILGGEKEEKNGIWRFKNKKNGIYMNDIPRRNCN
jgi:hypothetical protein